MVKYSFWKKWNFPSKPLEFWIFHFLFKFQVPFPSIIHPGIFSFSIDISTLCMHYACMDESFASAINITYTVARNKPDTIKSVMISWCFIRPKILYHGVIGMTIENLIMHHLSFWPCILWLRYLHICTLAEYQIHAPKIPEIWTLWVLSDNIFWLSLD